MSRQHEPVAELFGGFAHPDRLRILELLGARELSVGQLAGGLGRGQPHTSAQLARLRACGLVRTRRDHRYVYYRVADQRVLWMLALMRALARDRTTNMATASAAPTTARGRP